MPPFGLDPPWQPEAVIFIGSGRLSELDGRDGPVPFVSSDRDAEAMYFVEPDALNRTGLAVGKDHGLADKLSLGARELAEDRARALLHGWHDDVPQIGCRSAVVCL